MVDDSQVRFCYVLLCFLFTIHWFGNVLPVFASNDLDCHQIHGLVVHAFEDLSRVACANHLQYLKAVGQVVIEDLWIKGYSFMKSIVRILLSSTLFPDAAYLLYLHSQHQTADRETLVTYWLTQCGIQQVKEADISLRSGWKLKQS